MQPSAGAGRYGYVQERPTPGVVCTVHCMATAGSVAASVRDCLVAQHSSPPPAKPYERQALAWVERSVDTARPKSTVKASLVPAQVCCCRMQGITVFLGDKITVERFCDEAKVVAVRKRATGEATCVHQAERDRLPLALRATDALPPLVNFFPATKAVTLKAKMVQTLCGVYGPRRVFASLTPETFILFPGAVGADERVSFAAALPAPDPHFPENVWIAKQSHGKGGEGVCIVDGGRAGDARQQRVAFDKVCAYVDANPNEFPWVVQRYAAAPLLLRGRKFDLRHWVLVTPNLQVWLHAEGVCRTSSEPYTPGGYENHIVHVTNHYWQVTSKNYGKHEPGNFISFAELQDRMLKELRVSVAGSPGCTRPVDYTRDIEPQVKAIIVNVLASVREGMLPEFRPPFAPPYRSWQLLGFDFIIDQQLKVWLLETNGAPGIAAHMHDAMVDDVLELLAPSLPAGAVNVAKIRSGATAVKSATQAAHFDATYKVPANAAAAGGRPTPRPNGFVKIFDLAAPLSGNPAKLC